MAVVGVGSLYQLKIFIKTPKTGWGEQFWLTASTSETALISAAKGVWWRACWLAQGLYVRWARITRPGVPRDGRSVAGAWKVAGATAAGIVQAWNKLPQFYPLTEAATTLLKPNDPFVGPRYRSETADGQWANRFITGVPDGDVYDLAWLGDGTEDAPQAPPAPLIGAVPAAGDTAVSKLAGRSAFLNWIITDTQLAERIDVIRGAPNPVLTTSTWDTFPWFNIDFVEVGKHAKGRPFGLFKGRNR